MTLEQLEAEVLALSKDSQVILLARLLERLGQESGIDQEIAASWAEEVFQRVRASFTELVENRIQKSISRGFKPPKFC
ncbi:addiction module component [Nostoc sp. TCL240-02]|uniref:addiction module component n=1 Tax=Nostoc sp. TCL240-02 TaxID=2572090 RepID=UPI00157FA2B4|nr:addiction module component [Nostoc sp. TCL240-02]QKQ72906.1 addiction module component [Nostoc sp. TCL240-02]